MSKQIKIKSFKKSLEGKTKDDKQHNMTPAEWKVYSFLLEHNLRSPDFIVEIFSFLKLIRKEGYQQARDEMRKRGIVFTYRELIMLENTLDSANKGYNNIRKKLRIELKQKIKGVEKK